MKFSFFSFSELWIYLRWSVRLLSSRGKTIYEDHVDSWSYINRVVEGSNDGGSSWHVLDQQTSQVFDKRFQRKTYKIRSTGFLSNIFRWTIVVHSLFICNLKVYLSRNLHLTWYHGWQISVSGCERHSINFKAASR